MLYYGDMEESANNFSINQTINLAVGLGVFVLIFFFGLQVVNKSLRIKAVDECGHVSKYEKTLTEEHAKVTYPLAEVYKNCLKDKGY